MSLGPIEAKVLACLRRRATWVGLSIIARDTRLPVRQVRHHADRHVARGTLERTDLPTLLAAQPVGARTLLPECDPGEQLYRYTYSALGSRIIDTEHVERPLAD